MADPFVQQQFPAAIAAEASLSGQVDIGGYPLVGILVPASWTTAPITLQGSPDGGTTWGELTDISGVPIEISSLTAGTAYFVALDPARLRGLRSIRVRSGTLASPVAQTSAITLTLLTRPVF